MGIPQLAIYGLGRAGRALADACVRANLPLCAVGVRDESSKGRDFEGATFHTGLRPLIGSVPPGTVMLLAVRDDAIGEVAAECAGVEGAGQLRFAHLSGAQGLEPLAPLVDLGCPCGVFHVLQSFPETGGAARIPGSYAGVAGEPGLAGDLRDLALALGCTPFTLTDDQRSAYHAAAVLASNALVALLGTGRDILVEAGIDPKPAGEMLLPLVTGTLENMEGATPEQALTGPVVRGDAGTIRRHLEVLSGEARRTYIAVIGAAVELAARAGRTPAEKLDEIRRVLEDAS